ASGTARDRPRAPYWRSDDAGIHWTRVGTLPTTNEHGIFTARRGTTKQPPLCAILPNATGYQDDRTGYPQPLISEAPSALKVHEDGGKTRQSGPSADTPPGLVMYYPACGVPSDGSMVIPRLAKGYQNAWPEPPLTLCRWRSGYHSWLRLTPVPYPGQ